jgi:hypothetical protein
VKVQYKKGVASRLVPESCVARREVRSEMLTGDTGRAAIEPLNFQSGMLTPYTKADEGGQVKTVLYSTH